MITLLEFLLKKHIDIDPESIDLDLPSGTLWCSHNVGAEKPEDYGDYFAWGETEPKKAYTWETYKFGTWESLIKYNEKDHKTELDPEDDAAHTNMGGDWHMPTTVQIKELEKYTINEWDTLNGVNGRLFTSKKNNNSIFIPAAGYYDDIDLLNDGNDGAGLVWHSSMNNICPSVAFCICFDTDHVSSFDVDRCYGLSVRGVIDKK